MRWWLVGALALGCSCSPYGGGSFTCSENAQCAPNGTCSSGFCAFPDPSCPSMLKYGDSSGPNSGKCVGANGNIDGGIDVDADNSTPDGAVCYGNSLVHACFAAAPTGTKTVNAAINTATSNMCATLVGPNANAWCVIAGSSVSVTGTVQVTGNRPLVLLSTGTLDVGGTLDIASHRGGSLGPDADAAGCNAGTAPTLQSGGAGGSLGGVGGAGTAAGNGAVGGVAGAKLTPTALRGGCPGQKGSGSGGGNGGHGGGAVWLFASTSITIGGTINASGSSGDGGANASSSGGGAGGSGGYVGLESPSVTLTGSIFANGGGGGEGSGPASTGDFGTDSPNVTTAASGGSGGSFSGTDGGDGSLGTALDGSPATACGGCASGGGGGGGAGIIKVVPPQSVGGQLSPPAT